MFVLFPLADLGGLVAEFEKFIADETEKWGRVISAANIMEEPIHKRADTP